MRVCNELDALKFCRWGWSREENVRVSDAPENLGHMLLSYRVHGTSCLVRNLVPSGMEQMAKSQSKRQIVFTLALPTLREALARRLVWLCLDIGAEGDWTEVNWWGLISTGRLGIASHSKQCICIRELTCSPPHILCEPDIDTCPESIRFTLALL